MSRVQLFANERTVKQKTVRLNTPGSTCWILPISLSNKVGIWTKSEDCTKEDSYLRQILLVIQSPMKSSCATTHLTLTTNRWTTSLISK